MHDDPFEARLAEWLEEGPFEAPYQALPAAMAHAQAHPRRRFGLRRLSQVATIRLGSTPDPLSGGAVRLNAFGVIGAGVLVVALIAVGWLAVPRTGPNQPVVGPPGPTTTPTPTASASVIATSECHEVDPGTTSSVTATTGDITQRREVTYECTFASVDPRLQGSATFVLNADERADGRADIWGSATVETDGGGWDGFWIGTVEAGSPVYRIEAGYQGTGGYEGLRLGTHQASEELSGTIDGTIADVGTPPTATERVITGSHCTVLNGFMASTPLDSTTQERGARLACRVQSADPRLAAERETVVANGDERPDGSATIWGTTTLANDGGSWHSTWEGTVEAGYTTHRMDGVAVGEGGYAGLEFHWSQIGTNELIVQIGTVTATP